MRDMVVASFVGSLFRSVDLKSKRALGVLMIAAAVTVRYRVLQARSDLRGYRINAAVFDAINLYYSFNTAYTV